MINNTNFTTMGIKIDGEDIRDKIEPIINNAQQFLLLGTYNFTISKYPFPQSFIYSALANNNIAIKGIIIPNFATHYKKSYPVNDIVNVLNNLVDIGVGVVIEPSNHSKFILSEKDLYFGSANFSETAMKHNLEVITIFNDDKVNHGWFTRLRLDFATIFHQKLSFTQPNGINATNAIIINNLNTVKGLVLKLNPNATKVKRTIENYEICLYKFRIIKCRSIM